jgi:hypothetical protein
MARREGEAIRGHLKRNSPHHVPLPAEKMRSLMDSEVIFALPPPYRRRRSRTLFVVFCFAKLEDEQAFANRFGGIRRAAAGVVILQSALQNLLLSRSRTWRLRSPQACWSGEVLVQNVLRPPPQ